MRSLQSQYRNLIAAISTTNKVESEMEDDKGMAFSLKERNVGVDVSLAEIYVLSSLKQVKTDLLSS